ncbi:DUF2779 domain-containing protein [Rosistilla ulvae]|nr:DUF2779 domain-containing protein [Rosistilla ulvae]
MELMTRYLTKSRFILGHGCPTKLFYTKKPEYANSREADEFLQSLAEGGMIVGELAKLYFPGGHDVSTLNYDTALEETSQLLLQNDVVIFEAAVAYENLFCRIDVLVKKGNELQLIEVKAKSIDGNDSDPFRGTRGGVLSDWKKYLLDVAFQRLIFQQAFPTFTVSSWLMCVDKTEECTVDGLHRLFKIESDGSRTSCVFVGDDPAGSICREILKRRRVDGHIDELCSDDFGGRDFEQYVRWLADNYSRDTKVTPEIGVHCRDCEFRCTQQQSDNDRQDGFRECWSEVLGWSDADFDRPTVFDLNNFRRAQEFIDQRRIALEDLTEDDLDFETDAKPGLHPKEMQRVRLNSLKSSSSNAFVDTEGLAEVSRTWRFPLHFIDFETAAPAVPLHRGLRPYQSLAFQFSHHTLGEDGSVSHTGQYLNSELGAFPNFDFLRNLKSSLDGDNGTIFRYAAHENTILNHIVEQLDEFGRHESDYEELRNFACSVSRPTRSHPNPWTVGDRDMVDLRELVARHYYHPRMRGSQSIKYVLPAVLTDSAFLQEKYSYPIYGYEVDSRSSQNFSRQTWIQFREDTVIDPYELLPAVFDDIDRETWNEFWTDEDIRGGGAAMAAYLRLQQETLPQGYRKKVEQGLLKYCELDTLAMVMIVESWRNHPR